MKPVVWLSLLLCVFLSIAVESGAQMLVGALAVGERWGWAVDYETEAAAREAALRECGAGCSVVLTFDRCGAYAADQDAGSTAAGWAEAYASADAARQAALAECRSRGGGSGCTVRAWGCNGPVIEEGLNLDRTARRRIQQGLAAGSFDPGAADGLFGPRTRAAIRRWQSSRGAWPTGYLERASAEALQTADRSGPAAAAEAMQAPPPPASAELEGLFWQSIMNSTNPAEFEAYLSQFPNGVFRTLAQARLAALRSAVAASQAAGGPRVAETGARSSGARVPRARVSGGEAPAFGTHPPEADRRAPGTVFRDCPTCPEMVVVPAGRFQMGCVSGRDCQYDERPVHEVQVPSFALGVYEVTFEEYERFAGATGRDRPNDGGWGRGGRPVINVSWENAQAYATWLSDETGEDYRLPSDSEWEYAARAGTTTQYSWGQDIGRNRANCGDCGSRWDGDETAPAGSFAPNAWGLHDMHGNVLEWVEDCWHENYARAPRDGSAWTSGRNCGRRVLRGGSWGDHPAYLRSADRRFGDVGARYDHIGFRVSRPLD